MIQKTIWLVMILCCLGTVGLGAQTTPTPQPDQTAAGTPTPLPGGATPNPAQPQPKTASGAAPGPEAYTLTEFAPWMLDVRRGEIILVGALPLTFFVVNECFDIFRFIKESIVAGSLDGSYAPWPFESPQKAAYTENEKLGIILAATTSALAVAVADYLIGRHKGRDLAGGDK